jgi:MinD-like ATPase involved in chromosome partitioning or flagellar assembly/tetratricopeptide (TPR) repeat protein
MGMTPPDRRLITFYSFKGGVGRTMTLANVAYRLANKHGLKVIAVDWDLEAPGLHKFFGISEKQAAKAHGVLDYFRVWREAMARKDPGPPSVLDWIIPITDEKHKPRFGELSLLLAGKIDAKYDARLAAFNWQEFYKEGAGAAAVETLREQLVGHADVVLVDSRTGLTDPGGICTIQIPDGVVIMTGPNQQSLEGSSRVARSIAKASKDKRAGRERPKVWLVVSRVPSVEETYLTEQWFTANEPWFQARVEQGLWRKEDHAEGLRSHKIPHRGRWGFDEVVLGEAIRADAEDPMVAPYERLAETLLRWLRRETPLDLESNREAARAPASWRDIPSLEIEIADAERRGDIFGMAVSLRNLALGLTATGRYDEAIRRAEQACGIFLSRGARADYLYSLDALGWTLTIAKRFAEAEPILAKGLGIAQELGDLQAEALLHIRIAVARFEQAFKKDALLFISNSERITNSISEGKRYHLLFLIGGALVKFSEQITEAIAVLRESARLSRSYTDTWYEEAALELLLRISDAGENLSDADALRTRLAELQAAHPAAK